MRKALQILFLGAIAIPPLGGARRNGHVSDALTAYTKGDYKTALKLLLPMAEEGNSFAEFTIGKMYVYGEGIPKDPKKGIFYMQRAADKGLAIAQYHLAQVYTKGLGVPKNPTTAALYYQKAAEQGDADSQFALGMQYLEGQGVFKDLCSRRPLGLPKPRVRVIPQAQYQLGVLCRQGQGVAKKTRRMPLTWFLQSRRSTRQCPGAI